MLENSLKYSLYQNSFCGVEHAQNNSIHFLLLNKKKDTFTIAKQGTVNAVKELQKLLDKEQHLHLTINTDDVLTKKIVGIVEFDKAVLNAFSNINVSDFYIEVLHTTNDTYVSICRKDIVNTILLKYQENKLLVISFSLGNLVGSLLANIVNVDINTTNATITYQNNQLTDIKNNESLISSKYDINGLEIKSTAVLSLSGIIKYYTQNNSIQNNFNEKLTNLFSTFKLSRIFTLGLKIGLFIIFSLLLVSFLVFSNYQSKVNQLSNENLVSKSLKEKLIHLQSKIDKKKKLLDQLNNGTNSKASFYLDQLGVLVPSSILLSQISFQPKQKNIKKGKEILVDYNTLFVYGKSTNSKIYSNWIENIEQLTWVKQVEILNYGIGKEKVTIFEIKISIQ